MAENADLEVLQGSTKFAINLHKILSEEDGNILFSPIGLHVVLSMVYQGAFGTTAEQFSNTLQIPRAQATAENYKSALIYLNSQENMTLLMANKIYIKENALLQDDFKSSVSDNFFSEVESIDFSDEKTIKTINDWIEFQTRKKICNMIEPKGLDASTQLFLINAVYFQGNWLHRFNRERTETQPFYVNEEETVDVKMMTCSHNPFRVCFKDKTLNANILELPYANENIAMIIMLPLELNGIQHLEENLASIDMNEIMKNLFRQDMEISIPRFKIEKTVHLNDALVKLGLGEIFTENANFGGIVEEGSLNVSQVLQRAVIEVDEGDNVMTGATSLDTSMSCDEIKVDHPFVFFLVHKSKTDVIPLLVGKVMRP